MIYLKSIKNTLTWEDLTHDQIKELSNLFDAFCWQTFKDHTELLLDLVLFHYPDYVNRYIICTNNKPSSMEYLQARYGHDQNQINYIKLKKSNNAKKSFNNCKEYLDHQQRVRSSSFSLENIINSIDFKNKVILFDDYKRNVESKESIVNKGIDEIEKIKQENLRLSKLVETTLGIAQENKEDIRTKKYIFEYIDV